MPFFEKSADGFASLPYPLAFSGNDELIGRPQRYGLSSFVVNTDKISREMGEDQGWKLFSDPAVADRYGALNYDNWNVMQMCMTGDQNPFEPIQGEGLKTFRATANAILGDRAHPSGRT